MSLLHHLRDSCNWLVKNCLGIGVLSTKQKNGPSSGPLSLQYSRAAVTGHIYLMVCLLINNIWHYFPVLCLKFFMCISTAPGSTDDFNWNSIEWNCKLFWATEVVWVIFPTLKNAWKAIKYMAFNSIFKKNDEEVCCNEAINCCKIKYVIGSLVSLLSPIFLRHCKGFLWQMIVWHHEIHQFCVSK